MPKTRPVQADQSVNGLFRALGRRRRARCARTRPLYRRLVTLIEGGIARGDLPARFQLPPERDLAAAMRISRATVVSAYRELEARGLVRGYVGRGTFVSATAGHGQRAVRLARQDRRVRAAGDRHDACGISCAPPPIRTLISVAAGVPALDCFPTDAFQRAMNTRARARRPMPPGGTVRPKGCRVSAPRWRTRFGGDPEHILVLAGAQQGLDLLARCLIDPGDAVVIDRPGYLGAIQTFRDCRRAAGRVGHHARGHRRTRGAAAALSPEVDLHQPDAPESDRRHHADPHAARDCSSWRRAIACRSSRTTPIATCR